MLLEAEDGELILRVPFTEMLKVSSFVLVGVEEHTAPLKVRLFINREDVDFDNVSNIKPVQEAMVTWDVTGDVDNPVIPSKFSSVQSIIMHITGTEDELMQIAAVGFKGESKGLNPKVVEGIKYEIKPQMKDHATTRADQTGNFDLS